MTTDEKVPIALGMERAATTTDARVRKTEAVRYGDAVGAAAIASTEGVRAEYRGTGCWVVVVTLAEQEGDTQTGFSYRIARRVEDLDHDGVVSEAVERAARMLGATKPATARVPVLLDPVAASSFLGVLSDGLSAEAVQKQRSLFGPLVGEQVASDVLTVVDDGRLLDGPGAAPFDGEGVPTGRTELLSSGVLNGFLHNTYTARRGDTRSTGNAVRGYRAPGVGTTNLFVQPGDRSFEQLLREAEGGVLVQDVTGVHSGANPISGEFSVGATGLRISGGDLGPGARDDDREHDPRDAAERRRARERAPMVLRGRGPVHPAGRDDARGRLTRLRSPPNARARDHAEHQGGDADPEPEEDREVVHPQVPQEERDHEEAAHGRGADPGDERPREPGGIPSPARSRPS